MLSGVFISCYFTLILFYFSMGIGGKGIHSTVNVIKELSILRRGVLFGELVVLNLKDKGLTFKRF